MPPKRLKRLKPTSAQWQAGRVLAAKVFVLRNSESPEFIGRAVAALAADPSVSCRSGAILVAAALAEEYGFTDIDGRRPRALTLADV